MHAYIVVQPVGDSSYRVRVTAKNDVPNFLPVLPRSGIFSRGKAFKEFLLRKLINAEVACYRASQFNKLEQRTRASLLANLQKELALKTQQYLGYDLGVNAGDPVIKQMEDITLTSHKRPSSTIMDSVKRVLTSKSKTSAASSSENGVLQEQNSHSKVAKSKSVLSAPHYALSQEQYQQPPHLNGIIPQPKLSPVHQALGDHPGVNGYIGSYPRNKWKPQTSESDDSSLNSVEVDHPQ